MNEIKDNPEVVGKLPELSEIIKAGSQGNLPTLSEAIGQSTSFFQSPLFVTTMSILILGLVIFLLMTYLIANGKNPLEILKAFGIPLIIISSVLLILSGFDSSQISPIIGLLGTIAGYLLGRSHEEHLMARKKGDLD